VVIKTQALAATLRAQVPNEALFELVMEQLPETLTADEDIFRALDPLQSQISAAIATAHQALWAARRDAFLVNLVRPCDVLSGKKFDIALAMYEGAVLDKLRDPARFDCVERIRGLTQDYAASGGVVLDWYVTGHSINGPVQAYDEQVRGEYSAAGLAEHVHPLSDLDQLFIYVSEELVSDVSSWAERHGFTGVMPRDTAPRIKGLFTAAEATAFLKQYQG